MTQPDLFGTTPTAPAELEPLAGAALVPDVDDEDEGFHVDRDLDDRERTFLLAIADMAASLADIQTAVLRLSHGGNERVIDAFAAAHPFEFDSIRTSLRHLVRAATLYAEPARELLAFARDWFTDERDYANTELVEQLTAEEDDAIAGVLGFLRLHTLPKETVTE